ncbi:MAG: hypothetical protein CO064_10080 [Anaerolineae bacterium CG_4_9_14_0_8_um_filter_58_9]|nr:MAG: hypothetical protein CO064_10080 [Anaerolineae bacterium CG_4_9_14_0_8_um_filter_58_9]
MNILDENVLESQRQLLMKWGVSIHQIGQDVGRKGMDDEEIIPFLLTLRQPTFFTQDSDFFKRSLCHSRYGLIHLDVDEMEAATFIRRLLRHREFDTYAKRMGVVIRASHMGLSVWRLHVEQEEHFAWKD